MKRVILLSLLLIGCTQFQQTAKPMVDVFVGTQALDAKFSSESISNIFMCGQSNLWVELHNKGAFDITDGAYSFIVEDQIMSVDQKQRQGIVSLSGKSEFNPIGGMTQIQLSLKNKGLPKQLESYSTPVVFQACYPYETQAAPIICIDPDISNLNMVKACTPQEVSLSGGQGAPVAVTRVIPTMLVEDEKVTPAFRIFIQHVGTGQVVSNKGALLACQGVSVDSAEQRLLLSEVVLKASMQGRSLMCGPKGEDSFKVRLTAGVESEVLCRGFELSNRRQAAFTTPLFIDLEYGYVTTTVFPISITRMQGQSECKIA